LKFEPSKELLAKQRFLLDYVQGMSNIVPHLMLIRTYINNFIPIDIKQCDCADCNANRLELRKFEMLYTEMMYIYTKEVQNG